MDGSAGEPDPFRTEPPTSTVPAPNVTPAEAVELQVHFRSVYSYTYHVVTDPADATPGIGTAVLVQIGPRLLVATAKHVVERRPQLMTRQSETIGPPTPFLRRILHPHYDLALLELENDPGLARCSADQLREDDPPRPPDPARPTGPCTWIVGFPEARTRRLGSRTEVTRENFGTHPTRITGDYVEMAFPPGGYRYDAALHAHVPVDMPEHPRGFSGAGGWCFVRGRTDKLNLPQDLIRFQVIQFAWSPEDRVVKCYSVRAWIKLVFDHYPDLRDLLRERFAFLRG